MQAYVVTKPGHAEIKEVERPEPGPYDALVRIELCVICNSTDRMIVKGTFPHSIHYPCALGHESLGTVVSVGERVTSYRIGDRVTRAGYRPGADSAVRSSWGGFAAYGVVETDRTSRTKIRRS